MGDEISTGGVFGIIVISHQYIIVTISFHFFFVFFVRGCFDTVTFYFAFPSHLIPISHSIYLSVYLYSRMQSIISHISFVMTSLKVVKGC